MLTTLRHRFTAFLAAWAAWLVAKSVGCWPAFRARARICFYLWSGRQSPCQVGRHTPRRSPQGPPPPVTAPTPSLRPGPASSCLVRIPPTRPPGCLPNGAAAANATAGAAALLFPLGFLSSDAAAHRRSTSPVATRDRPQHKPSPPPRPTAPAAGAGSNAGSGAWRRYHGGTAARSVRYKIHGYGPSDLRPKWRCRLDAMARRGGACLVGSYVRPGCVELTMDLLIASTSTSTAALCGAAGGPPPPKAMAAMALTAPGSGTTPSPMAVPDVKQIMDALGLGAARAGADIKGHGGTALGTAASKAGSTAADDVQVQVLGTEPAATTAAPWVAGLSPRVLLLPPLTSAPANTATPVERGQVARAESSDSSSDTCVELAVEEWSSEGEEAAGVRVAAAVPLSPSAAGRAVVLRATVHRRRPTGHHDGAHDGESCCRPAAPLGAPAIFARAHGEILPALVTRIRPVASAAVTGPHDGAACGDFCCETYELEVLLDLPRRAGVVLMELAWQDQSGQLLPLLALPAAEALAAAELQALAASAAEVPSPAPPPASPSSDPSLLPPPQQQQQRPQSHPQQQHQHQQLLRQQQLLSSLLLDAGVWAHGLAAPSQRSPELTGPGLSQAMRLPARQRAVLGTNLMRFAVHSGLRETEAWLARGLAQLESELKEVAAAAAATAMETAAAACPVAPPPSAADEAIGRIATPIFSGSCPVYESQAETATAAALVRLSPPAAVTAAAAAAAVDGADNAACCGGGDGDEQCTKGACAVEADEGLRRRRQAAGCGGGVVCASGDAAVARRGDAGVPAKSASPAAAASPSLGWSVWLHALLLVLGFRHVEPGEEEAFRAWVLPWEANQEHIIQAFEVAALAALLFRARGDLLSPANLTTLLGGLPGLLTTLAAATLRRPAWTRLARSIKLPRYMLYMAAKALAVFLNRPLPPGVTSYQLGLGMVLHEGLLLPLACLLPVHSAAAVTLLKILPCVAMMLTAGVAPSRRQASFRCAAVGAVALPTTVFCHTYLRACFYRWRHRRRQRRCADGVDGAGGALTC